MDEKKPEEVKKPGTPGTTRILFILIGVSLAIFAFVIGKFAWQADMPTLERLALIAMGAVGGAFGTAIAFLFTKRE